MHAPSITAPPSSLKSAEICEICGLQMTGIVKSFDGQRVLHGVDFDLRRGEVHVLAGENGAGKSTLIRILGGVYRPDRGEITIDGVACRFRSPRDAAARGVAIIHQELSLAPSLSVADNVVLGRERATWGWTRFGPQHAQCAALLERLGLALDPRQAVETLPIALQQMVEIAKALARRADVVVMDEPTSALNEPEVQRLLECIAELKSQGCGVIYITHKLEEVYRIADRVTVLRDGHRVASAAAADMPADVLIRHMVGRDLRRQPARIATTPYGRGGEEAASEPPVSASEPRASARAESETEQHSPVTERHPNLRAPAFKRGSSRGVTPRGRKPAARCGGTAPVVLELKDVTVRDAERGRRPRVEPLSLSVHAGEIVGLAGLHGCGNSDLLMALFGGCGRRVTGTILLNGRPYRPTSPRRAIARGLALVTNDRQRTGLVLGMSVAANATLASLPRVSPWGWMRPAREMRLADEATRSLQLRAASLRQSVATLSGGNQQKVVLAKWIATRPRVILLDEPTRGVDVGAKQEIYQLMLAWRDAGCALILITSETPELIMMCDRILVMHRGRPRAMLARGQATQERILHAAMGGGDLGD